LNMKRWYILPQIEVSQNVDVAVFAQGLRQAVVDSLGGEIDVASQNLNQYSLENVQNPLTAYAVMNDFSHQALDVWNTRFNNTDGELLARPERAKPNRKSLSRDATNRVRVETSEAEYAGREMCRRTRPVNSGRWAG
jgi:hypothetical protein